MTHHRTIEITLTLPVVVETRRERDDDGCPSASVTGNSMTGVRGWVTTVEKAEIDMTKERLMDMAERQAMDWACDQVWEE